MNPALPPSPFYLITDTQAIGEACILDRVTAAARGGVGLVQIREKNLPPRAVAGLASRLKALLDPLGVPLLINDRLDIALAVGSAGVHLSSESSIPASVARRFLPPNALIGVSTHSPIEIRRAETEGADFVTFGPVYPTDSKKTYGPPQGIEALRAAVASTHLPVYALGGVTLDRLDQLKHAGAYGVAAISGWLGAEDAETNARKWVAAWG